MLKAEEIKVLNVDGEQYLVEAQPPLIKEKVAIYNKWAQEEIDLKVDLLRVQFAKTQIGQEIVQLIQKEKADADAAATPPSEAPAEE